MTLDEIYAADDRLFAALRRSGLREADGRDLRRALHRMYAAAGPEPGPALLEMLTGGRREALRVALGLLSQVIDPDVLEPLRDEIAELGGLRVRSTLVHHDGGDATIVVSGDEGADAVLRMRPGGVVGAEVSDAMIDRVAPRPRRPDRRGRSPSPAHQDASGSTSPPGLSSS